MRFYSTAERGQAGAKDIVSLIVFAFVAAIIAAFLLPIGIDQLAASANDTEGWSGGASALWGILDVILVLGAFLLFVGIAMSASDRL